MRCGEKAHSGRHASVCYTVRILPIVAISNAAVLLAAALLSGCGGPTDNTVRADFLRRHPTYAIVSVGVGEGDGAAAYYHIRYKRPKDSAEYEAIWQYLDTGNGEWKLNHQSPVQ